MKSSQNELISTPAEPPAPAPKAEPHPQTTPLPSVVPREIGGRDGPEPTRFGDWEKAGRCIDF